MGGILLEDGLIKRLALGGAAGVAGTFAIQGLLVASQKWLPQAMPPMRQDPGEFMVERAEETLPETTQQQVPEVVETAAVRSLAIGYGLTAGALYGGLRAGDPHLVRDGAALGLTIWAVGYLGWLPALRLTPPIGQQTPPQVIGPAVQHIVYGFVTTAAYAWLRNRWA